MFLFNILNSPITVTWGVTVIDVAPEIMKNRKSDVEVWGASLYGGLGGRGPCN